MRRRVLKMSSAQLRSRAQSASRLLAQVVFTEVFPSILSTTLFTTCESWDKRFLGLAVWLRGECLPGTHKAPGSRPSTGKEKSPSTDVHSHARALVREWHACGTRAMRRTSSLPMETYLRFRKGEWLPFPEAAHTRLGGPAAARDRDAARSRTQRLSPLQPSLQSTAGMLASPACTSTLLSFAPPRWQDPWTPEGHAVHMPWPPASTPPWQLPHSLSQELP